MVSLMATPMVNSLMDTFPAAMAMVSLGTSSQVYLMVMVMVEMEVEALGVMVGALEATEEVLVAMEVD